MVKNSQGGWHGRNTDVQTWMGLYWWHSLSVVATSVVRLKLIFTVLAVY